MVWGWDIGREPLSPGPVAQPHLPSRHCNCRGPGKGLVKPWPCTGETAPGKPLPGARRQQPRALHRADTH